MFCNIIKFSFSSFSCGKCANIVTDKVRVLFFLFWIILLLEKQSVSYSKKVSDDTMVDPKHVVSYEDMLKVIHQPEKVIIDVREPDEVHSTGKIPSSINIPLKSVDDVLSSMSEDEFKRQFNRSKPSSSDELIFYCRSGRRSQEALDRALKLGYSKSKTYVGSWNDWSSKHRLK